MKYHRQSGVKGRYFFRAYDPITSNAVCGEGSLSGLKTTSSLHLHMTKTHIDLPVTALLEAINIIRLYLHLGESF